MTFLITAIMTIQTMGIKLKQSLKLRHELKHGINQQDDIVLSHRLRKLFKPDMNADSHGIYRVSSLYFDTPTDTALKDKQDGVLNREKFRLRYYNKNTDFVKLEKKIKRNNLVAKHSLTLNHQQTQKILNNEIEFLLDIDHPLAIEFYSKVKGQCLRPKSIVIYDREALIYEPGNVRITFDRNIRTSLNNLEFLDPQNHHLKLYDLHNILEIKYDQFIPDIVKIAVSMDNRPSSALSKYAMSRMIR